MHLDLQGWWGEPTSSVDWCEYNYHVSYYIAEFYNTISSFSIFFLGVYGLLKHRGILQSRYDLMLFSYSMVGLGSAAFHGTLLFPFQCLDELPMCYTALLLVYCVLEDTKEDKHSPWLKILFTFWGLLITYAVSSSDHQWQFLVFQASFGVLEIAILYLYYKKTAPYEFLRPWYKQAAYGYVFAASVWLTDLKLCHYIRMLPFNPQLHSWWHILACTSTYLLVLLAFSLKAQSQNLKPRIAYIPYINFPYRVCVDTTSAEKLNSKQQPEKEE